MGKQKKETKPAEADLTAQIKDQPLEDRVLKEAAQLFGEELLPLLGIKEKIRRIAPTEQVYLNPQDFMQDFNYEMENGSWLHVEFESDSIRTDDLRRFRTYESVISYTYKVQVTTCVICSSRVKALKNHLTEGINTYRVRVIRLKDRDAGRILRILEHKRQKGFLSRADLLQLVLIPLRGGEISQPERISRAVVLLAGMRGYMERDDLMRVEAALYTLAMKFLTVTELKEIKELMNMTVLGEMILQDGIKEGIKKGIAQERKNTDRERQRAEKAEARAKAAETRLKEVEELLQKLKQEQD